VVVGSIRGRLLHHVIVHALSHAHHGTALFTTHHGLAILVEAIVEGAALRVRPIAMTVAVIVAGLLPVMWGSGTGSEIMRRIASPMVGGMIGAPLLSMLVLPAAYLLLRRSSMSSSK
jgi:copper/silver efflux system protein